MATLVLSRTNEDITWLTPLQTSFNILVYNKGTPIPASPHNRFITILPMGQEGGDAMSIVRYILDHYERTDFPADYVTIFTKAPCTQENLDALIQEAHTDPTGLAPTAPPPSDVLSATYRVTSIGQNTSITGMTYGEWFEKTLHPVLPPAPLLAFPSAFAVRRDTILARSRQFYEFLLAHLHQTTSEFIYFLQRSWYYVFSPAPATLPSLNELPNNIGVVIHGPSLAPYFQEDGRLHAIDALPAFRRIHDAIIAPLLASTPSKKITVYMYTNDHERLQDFKQALQGVMTPNPPTVIIKTRPITQCNLATSWPDTRRAFPNLWTDHEFLIVLRSDVFPLTHIQEWRLDPTAHNKTHLLEAFSTRATVEKNIIPPYYIYTPESFPLYTSLLRTRPLRA